MTDEAVAAAALLNLDESLPQIDSLTTLFYGSIYEKKANLEAELRRAKPWLAFDGKKPNAFLVFWKRQRLYEVSVVINPIKNTSHSLYLFANVHSAMRYGLYLIKSQPADFVNVTLRIFEVSPNRNGSKISIKTGELDGTKQYTAASGLLFPRSDTLDVELLDGIMGEVTNSKASRLDKATERWDRFVRDHPALMAPGLKFDDYGRFVLPHLKLLESFRFNQIVNLPSAMASMERGTLGNVLSALTDGAFVRYPNSDVRSERTDKLMNNQSYETYAPNNHPYAAPLASIFNRLALSPWGKVWKKSGISLGLHSSQQGSTLASDQFVASQIDNREEVAFKTDDEDAFSSVMKIVMSKIGKGDTSDAALDAVITSLKRQIQMRKTLPQDATIAPTHDWIIYFQHLKQIPVADRIHRIPAVTQPSYIRYLLMRSLGWDLQRVSFDISLDRETNRSLANRIEQRIAKRLLSFRTAVFNNNGELVNNEYVTESLAALASRDNGDYPYSLDHDVKSTETLLAHGTFAYTPLAEGEDHGHYSTTLITADQLYERGVVSIDLDTKAKANKLLVQAMRAYAILVDSSASPINVTDDGKYAAPSVYQQLREGVRPLTLDCPTAESQASSVRTKKRVKISINRRPGTTVRKEIEAEEESDHFNIMRVDAPQSPGEPIDPEATQPLDIDTVSPTLQRPIKRIEIEASEENEEELHMAEPGSRPPPIRAEVEADEEENVSSVSPPEVQQAQEIPPEEAPSSSLKRKRSDDDEEGELLQSGFDAISEESEKPTPIYQARVSATEFARYFKKPRLSDAAQRIVANAKVRAKVHTVKQALDSVDFDD